MTNTQTYTRQQLSNAALSYLWCFSVLIYWAQRQDPYVRFHAIQGMTLFVLSCLAYPLPYVGKYLIIFLAALMLIGFLNAHHGKMRKVPILGRYIFTENILRLNVLSFGHLLRLWYWQLCRLFSRKKDAFTEELAVVRQDLAAMAQSGTVEEDEKDYRDMAACSYLWIVSIIIYKNYAATSDYVRFHAQQGITLWFLSMLFFMIPEYGWILQTVVVLLAIFGLLFAYQGEKRTLPVIGRLGLLVNNINDFWWLLVAGSEWLGNRIGRWFSPSLVKQNWSTLYAHWQSKTPAEPALSPSPYDDVAVYNYCLLFPLLGLIHRENPLVRFHAGQAAFLLVIGVAVGFVPVIGWELATLVGGVYLSSALEARAGRVNYLVSWEFIKHLFRHPRVIVAATKQTMAPTQHWWRHLIKRDKATTVVQKVAAPSSPPAAASPTPPPPPSNTLYLNN